MPQGCGVTDELPHCVLRVHGLVAVRVATMSGQSSPTYHPWERVTDGDVVYYFNTVTNESQWEIPANSGSSTAAAAHPATHLVVADNARTSQSDTGGDFGGVVAAAATTRDNNSDLQSSSSLPPPSSLALTSSSMGVYPPVGSSSSSGSAQVINQQLFDAVSNGYRGPDLVRQLLALRADPAAHNQEGYLAIHLAAASGFTDCIDVLVAQGGAWLVSARSTQGDTPAHSACQAGDWAVATVECLYANADANNAGDGGGGTSAGRAHASSCFTACNHSNQTPLHSAAACGNAAVLQWLLQ